MTGWRSILREYFALPKIYWGSIRGLFVATVLATAAINILGLIFPLVVLQIYDRIIPNEAIVSLWALSGIVLLAVVFEIALKILRSYMASWHDAVLIHKLGVDVFSHLLHAPIKLVKKPVSTLFDQVSAVDELRHYYSGNAIVSLLELPFSLLFLAAIFYLGGFLVLVPLSMMVLAFAWGNKVSEPLQILQVGRADHDNSRYRFILECLNGIRTLKSCALESQMARRYEHIQHTDSDNEQRISRLSSQQHEDVLLLTQLTVVATVAVGAVLIINGALTVGALAACTLLASRSVVPVNRVVLLFSQAKKVKLAKLKISGLLHLPQEQHQIDDNKPLTGAIRANNIVFNLNEEAVLNGCDFDIAAGERVQMLSQHPSSWQALVEILLGRHSADAGEVYFDDYSVTELNVENLRQQVAYLPRSGHLYQGSIIDNISQFRSKQLYDQSIAIARALGVDDYIKRLPNGYDTQVGHQAVEAMPSGIHQRIILARSLVLPKRIIIFHQAGKLLDDVGAEALLKFLEQQTATILINTDNPYFMKLAQRRIQLPSTYTPERHNAFV